MTVLRYLPAFLCWVIGGSLLVSFYGPLAILNPFRHLLAMVETIEFTIAVLVADQAPYQLLPIATEAGLNAIAGIFGLVGWFSLMVAIFLDYGVTEI